MLITEIKQGDMFEEKDVIALQYECTSVSNDAVYAIDQHGMPHSFTLECLPDLVIINS